MSGSGFNDQAMLDLFAVEVQTHAATMSDGLLALERETDSTDSLGRLMRAAHSIKGAARLVGVEAAIGVAHAMENVFVAAQQGTLDLGSDAVDVLLQGVDLLTRVGAGGAEQQEALHSEARRCTATLEGLLQSAAANATVPSEVPAPARTTGNIDPGMLGLFCTEVETQTAVLYEGLLALERDPEDAPSLEALMRAAHSLKGAARMVGVGPAVELAHVMEDCFVAAQSRQLLLTPQSVDLLLEGADALRTLGAALTRDPQAGVAPELIAAIGALCTGAAERAPSDAVRRTVPTQPAPAAGGSDASANRVVRVSADRVNRLVGLAGELTVTSGWVRTYADAMLGLKKRQNDLITAIDRLRTVVEQSTVSDLGHSLLHDAQKLAYECRQQMARRLAELEDFDRRASNLSSRMSHEIIASRMRPFGDGVQGFPRMVRDVARDLGKKVELVIRGRDTQVDRDILEKIEAPLNHILRNAIDHGIESPAERTATGKPENGTILLEALHSAGMLSVVISDDGRGVDLEQLRAKVVRKKLVNARMAAELSETELLEFLFLPAFSTRDAVTEISGRGVGLDVVYNVVQEMRGHVRASSAPGQGMRIQLQLPLTLSVMRTLLVEVASELYAFPLARVENILRVPRESVQTLEDRQFVTTQDGRHIGLVYAGQVFEHEDPGRADAILPVVVIGARSRTYGVVVDRFLGERDLAVHTIDRRLGKIQDIAAAAITDDGTPLLIIDVEDVLHSIEKLVAGRHLHKFDGHDTQEAAAQKRILVVEDSLTVREVERKLLESHGYAVEIAVDGMEGWNAVRTNDFELVISDVDMPRMNGIELVTMIKNDPKLRRLPVMIVSYKNRPEDRQRGLEAGADYYLAKGSFHNDTLIEAVVDLIGEPA